MDDHPNVVNEEELDWTEESRDETFAAHRKQLGTAAGGERLGCSLYELPPGKRGWPYHYHTANEEAIYVLDGEGTLRTPRGETTIGSGDYVALPVGEDHARQVVNDSDAPLRYLCFSTMVEPEIAVYPDSEKVGLFAGSAPGKEEGRALEAFLPLSATVDYWSGESD